MSLEDDTRKMAEDLATFPNPPFSEVQNALIRAADDACIVMDMFRIGLQVALDMGLIYRKGQKHYKRRAKRWVRDAASGKRKRRRALAPPPPT